MNWPDEVWLVDWSLHFATTTPVQRLKAVCPKKYLGVGYHISYQYHCYAIKQLNLCCDWFQHTWIQSASWSRLRIPEHFIKWCWWLQMRLRISVLLKLRCSTQLWHVIVSPNWCFYYVSVLNWSVYVPSSLSYCLCIAIIVCTFSQQHYVMINRC